MSRRDWFVLIAILGSLGMSGFGWYNSHSAYKDVPLEKQELIVDRTFKNEVVEVDGKFFKHCNFQNVTLLYHGHKPFSMTDNSFNPFIFKTDDKAVLNAVEFLTQMTIVQHPEGEVTPKQQ